VAANFWIRDPLKFVSECSSYGGSKSTYIMREHIEGLQLGSPWRH